MNARHDRDNESNTLDVALETSNASMLYSFLSGNDEANSYKSLLHRRIDKKRHERKREKDETLGCYLQMSWLSELNQLNGQLTYTIPTSLIFESQSCELQSRAELRCKNSTQSGQLIQRDSNVRPSEDIPRSDCSNEHGNITAFTSSCLGLCGRSNNSEIDCIVLGTSSGYISLYRRIPKHREKRVSEPSRKPLVDPNHWRRILQFSISTTSGPSSNQTDSYSQSQQPTTCSISALSLLPPFPSLPSTVNGLLLCGTTHGALFLYILLNFSLIRRAGPPRVILSTSITPPSPSSAVTAVVLITPSDVLNPPLNALSSEVNSLISHEDSGGTLSVSCVSTDEVPSSDTDITVEYQSPSAKADSITLSGSSTTTTSAVSHSVPTAFASWASGDVFLLRFMLNPQLKAVCQRRRLWAPDPLLGPIYRATSYKVHPKGCNCSYIIVCLNCASGLMCLQLLPDLKVLFRRTFHDTKPLDKSQQSSSFSSSFIGIVETEVYDTNELFFYSIEFRNNEWKLPAILLHKFKWTTIILDMLNIDSGVLALLQDNHVVYLFVPINFDSTPSLIGQINLPGDQHLKQIQFLGCFQHTDEDVNNNGGHNNESLVLLLNQYIPSQCIIISATSPSIFVSKWLHRLESILKERNNDHDRNDNCIYQYPTNIDLVDIMIAILSHITVFSSVSAKWSLDKTFQSIAGMDNVLADGDTIQSTLSYDQRNVSLMTLSVQLCQQVFYILLNIPDNIDLFKISWLLKLMNHDYLDELPWATGDKSSTICLSKLSSIKSNTVTSFMSLLSSSLASLLLTTACLASIEFLYLLSPTDWLSAAPEALPAVTAKMTAYVSTMTAIALPNPSVFTLKKSDQEISDENLLQLSKIFFHFRADTGYAVISALEKASPPLKSSPKPLNHESSLKHVHFQHDWFNFIRPFLLIIQRNEGHVVKDAIDAAFSVSSESNELTTSREVLFEMLRALWKIVRLKNDPKMINSFSIHILSRMKELSNIDIQQTSQLFRMTCLSTIKMHKTRSSMNFNEKLSRSSSYDLFDLKMTTPNDEIKLNQQNSQLRFQSAEELSLSAFFELGVYLRQQLYIVNSWREEFILLEELLLHSNNLQIDSMTTTFIQRLIQLFSQYKSDDEFSAFLQKYSENHNIIEICFGALLLLKTDVSSEASSLKYNKDILKHPQSILLLYSMMGRLQEGQEVVKSVIIDVIRKGDDIQEVEQLIKVIQALCNWNQLSRMGVMSDQMFNQFLIVFINDLYYATLDDGVNGAIIWQQLMNEIINCGMTMKSGFSLSTSSSAMISLILSLLETTSKDESIKTNLAENDGDDINRVNRNTVHNLSCDPWRYLPDGKASPLYRLSLVNAHIQQSQKLLCQLAYHSSAQEHLLEAVAHCFESSLISALTQTLLREECGVPWGEFQLNPSLPETESEQLKTQHEETMGSLEDLSPCPIGSSALTTRTTLELSGTDVSSLPLSVLQQMSETSSKLNDCSLNSSSNKKLLLYRNDVDSPPSFTTIVSLGLQLDKNGIEFNLNNV